MGGSKQRGMFALSVKDGFLKGNSVKTESYQNEILSKRQDFKCMAVEIWAIED